MKYQIKRGNTVITSVALEGSQIRKALGEDLIDVSFKSGTALDIKVEDTVEVYGRVYKLNRPIEPTQADGIFYYTAQFEALWYDLIDVQFRGLGSDNQLTEAEFSIYATAYDIVDLAVRNANRVMSGWTIGVIDETERYNFTFNGQNVRQALNQLVEVFQSEIWFDNKTIHFQKREVQSGLSLSYGKGNGLYEFTRANRQDANVVTRLYVEGGSRNLPTGYGRTRLQLPAGQPYIQDAGVNKIKEHTETFENIFPERVGTVTGIVNNLTFIDTSMNFDINDHLSGMKAKIGFQTGKLAGWEFELNSYDHATKRFRLVLNKSDKAWPDGLPNETLKPEIGDKYIIFDINLPQVYIDDAEARLLAAGQEYYDRYKFDQFEFTVRMTPLWVKEQNPTIDLGHVVNVTNDELDIDKNTRIAGYTRDLQNQYNYELELADELTVAEVVRQFAQQQRILYAIQTAGLLDPEQMRRNLFLNRLSENDGYLFLGADKIKAGFADDSDKWAGHQFADYLNQPVRTTDAVQFAQVTANVLNAVQRLNVPTISNAAVNALWKSGSYAMFGAAKVWAGRADLWNGLAQPDYVTQPVRPTDSPRFEGVGSQSFASGFAGHGYRLAKDANDDYLLEVDRMLVRKDFNVYELIVNQIRATNGSLWVSDAIKIATVTVSGSNFVCAIDTDGGTIYTPFAVNDIVRCQVFNGKDMKYYTARVVSVTQDTFTITKLEGASNPAAGDELVRIGNTTNANRQGALYLTASDSGAPYLDVVDGVNSASLANKTKVRLGKLDGIVDPDFGALSGYGIYAQNGYFKGRLQVVAGSNVYTKTEANTEVATAKSEAISTAASDATTKANNARTQAVSTAAGDATAKANSAQANAIAAAASDATTKANNARDAAINTANQFAQDAVDAIEVGGRNYAKDTSAVPRTRTMTNYTASVIGEMYVNFEDMNLEVGDVVTFRSYISVPSGSPDAVRVRLDVYDDDLNYNQVAIGNFVQPNSSGYSVLTHTVRQSDMDGRTRFRLLYLRSIPGQGRPNFTFTEKEVKFEKGNKATDWSPAPEDIDAEIALRPTQDEIKAGIQINANAISVFGQSISMAGKVTFASLDTGAQGQITGAQSAASNAQSTANTANTNAGNAQSAANAADGKAVSAQGTANTALSNANTANNNLTALQNSLGSLAYDNQVQLAKLGNTIIEGGYLKADLINADTLISRQIKTNTNNTRMTINEDDDNLFKVRHGNGVVGIEMGLINGEPQLIFYNQNGAKVWEGGMQGIVYVNNVPESWSSAQLTPLTSSGTDPDSNGEITTAQRNTLRSAIHAQAFVIISGGMAVIKAGTTRYNYSAGVNPQAASNRQFEGWHTTQVKATNNWLPTGWYGYSGQQATMAPDGLYTSRIFFISTGKIIASAFIDNINP